MDWLGTHYGMIVAVAVCLTLLAAIFRLTGKYSGVEVGVGKVKLDANKTESRSIRKERVYIALDDWKKFYIELDKFIMNLVKPSEEYMPVLTIMSQEILSQSKKEYVERFLTFNHLPKYRTKEYNEYVREQTAAVINSGFRYVNLLCGNPYYEAPPEYDAKKICSGLSRLIEKYRNKENK